MRVLKIQGRNSSSEIIPLLTTDLRSGIIPKPSFVQAIADRVARDGDVEKPGFAIIPNPKIILRTREKVLHFQRSLMRALDVHLNKTRPRVLQSQDFLSLPHDEAQQRYNATKRIANHEVIVHGLNSYRMWHMDALSQIFVSLCYHRRSNIRGGNPQFLDLLRMMKVLGVASINELLEIHISEEEVFWMERYALLRYEQEDNAAQFTTRIRNLQVNTHMPIAIFSNRFEDGIMHGATQLQRVGKRPARSISYISIGHIVGHIA